MIVDEPAKHMPDTMRNLTISVLLWMACAIDLGGPVWTGISVTPSFLNLAFILTCLVCSPLSILFLGGAAGLLSTLSHGDPFVLAVPLYATVALVAATTTDESGRRKSLTGAAFRSLWILIAIEGGRTALRSLPASLTEGITAPSFTEFFGPAHLAQLAMTFLLAVVVCLVAVSLQRRSAWE